MCCESDELFTILWQVTISKISRPLTTPKLNLDAAVMRGGQHEVLGHDIIAQKLREIRTFEQERAAGHVSDLELVLVDLRSDDQEALFWASFMATLNHVQVRRMNLPSPPRADVAIGFDGWEHSASVTAFAVDNYGGVFGQDAEDVGFEFMFLLFAVVARHAPAGIAP